MAPYFVLIMCDRHRIRVLIYYFARLQPFLLGIFHNRLCHNDGNFAAIEIRMSASGERVGNINVTKNNGIITFRRVTVKLVLQLGQLSTSSSSCQRTDVSAARIFSSSICQ